MPIDMGASIDRCERTLSETPKLLRKLQTPNFVTKKLESVQDLAEVLGGRNPSLGITLLHLYTLLLKDDEIRKIMRKECQAVERDAEFFPFFMLFCAVIVYSEHIKLGKKSGSE